jgi:hypothetical protein
MMVSRALPFVRGAGQERGPAALARTNEALEQAAPPSSDGLTAPDVKPASLVLATSIGALGVVLGGLGYAARRRAPS